MTRRWLASVHARPSRRGCRTAGSVPPPPRPRPRPARAPAITRSTGCATRPNTRAATVQAYRMATRRIESSAPARPPGDVGRLPGRRRDRSRQLAVPKERAAAGLRSRARAGRDGWPAGPPRRSPGAAAFLRRVKETGGDDRHRHQPHAGRVPRHGGELPRPRPRPSTLMLCRADGGPSEKEPRYEAVAAGTARPGLRPLEIVLWVGDNIQDFPAAAAGDAQGGGGRVRRVRRAGSSSSPTRCTGPGSATPRSEPRLGHRAPVGDGLEERPAPSPRSRPRWGGRGRRTARAGWAGS